jgi:hypothetical protein
MYGLIPGNEVIPGRFSLVLPAAEGCSHALHADYASLAELADVACLVVNQMRWDDRLSGYATVEAFGPAGRRIDVAQLAVHGRRVQLSRSSWHNQPSPAGYVRRGGPVPGVHHRTHYRARRSLAVGSELRLAAMVVRDDGERAARAARNTNNLPDARDGHYRHHERTWKAFRKGRKAWDR